MELTPDHDDVGLVGYLGCGAQEVGKLLAGRVVRRSRLARNALSTLARSSSLSRPANGVRRMRRWVPTVTHRQVAAVAEADDVLA